MAESQVPVPATPDGPSLADWAEAAAIIEGRDLSKSSLRRRLLGGSLEEQDVDVQVEFLLDEVSRRARVAPSAYPFEVTRLGLSRKDGVDRAPYEFLLWLSVSPHFRERNGGIREIDELFDGLVEHALSTYLGPGTRAVRFGFPPSGGRPTGFPEAVEWLADLLNLGATSSMAPRSESKDGGVDVVAWRPFLDERSGFVVILCQCTVKKDWTSKVHDVVVRLWERWIDFGPPPLAALAVPIAVPLTFRRWDEIRQTALILDRLRLSELTDSSHLDQLEEIRAWANSERELLGV